MVGKPRASPNVYPLKPKLAKGRDKEADRSTLGAPPFFVSVLVGGDGGPAVDATHGLQALGVGDAVKGDGPHQGQPEANDENSLSQDTHASHPFARASLGWVWIQS